MISKLYRVVFCCLCAINLSSARKYDLETESQKLYGEDFAAVLRKFRKSPEYEQMLKYKMEEINQEFTWLMMKVQDQYKDIIDKKVKAILKYNTTQERTEIESDETLRGRKRRRPKTKFKLRQSNATEEEARNYTNVEWLDGYSGLTGDLTVKERNTFKDLGFEFAGKMVHDLIKAMSGDDIPSSTVLPIDDNELTTHDHSVTHEPRTSEGLPQSPAYSTTPPNTFRNKKHHML